MNKDKTYVVDMQDNHENLISQLDHFWNFIYTSQIDEIYANDDGKILYTLKEGA